MIRAVEPSLVTTLARHCLVGSLALLLLGVRPASAQVELQLRWEFRGDVFESADDRGASRVAFTLLNRGTQPLPRRGWAIYFNAPRPLPGAVTGGAAIETLGGDFQRLMPQPDFPGLASGNSITFEYRVPLIANIGAAPAGPYLVFDDAPVVGHPIRDYVAIPFTRSNAGAITPEGQYTLNARVRDVPLDELSPVLPTPLRTEKREGRLRLLAPPRVTASQELKAEADLAREYLRPLFAPRSATAAAGAVLRLETGRIEGYDSPEAYELVVDAQAGVRIVGNSSIGVFYGLQSLRGLLPALTSATAPSLPALRIVDAPRFPYRGLHLDVARNFQAKRSVLGVLDLMARYKLNVLHFHLTDDEGWRLEIPGLPELTAVGARRGHTLDSTGFLPPAYGSGPDVGKPYGSGFYARADYIEILKYAAARKIEVIPEIEMPGHARAALKAMDARSRSLRLASDTKGAAEFLLSDPDDRSVYNSAQNYHDNVMNPALPSTYVFITRVVQEIVAMHRDAGVPLRNLHMGGDEVPAGVWEQSPAAQTFIEANGFSSVDDLWAFFYGRVEQILKGYGIPLSGWEEIGLANTRRNGRVSSDNNPAFAERGWRTYVWNNLPGGGNEDLGYRLANGGYQVVLCSASNLYFDLAYNRNAEERGLNWAGYVDVDKPFMFVPLDYYRSLREDRRGNPIDPSIFTGKTQLTDKGRRNILGIQGELWSETLNADGRLAYMLVPKLLGLAERAWAADPAWAREADGAKAALLYDEAWSAFVNAVGKRELPRLAREQPDLHYRIPTPGLRVEQGELRANLQIPGFTIRYTNDGREPSVTDPEIRGSRALPGRVRAAAFDASGRKGNSAEILIE